MPRGAWFIAAGGTFFAAALGLFIFHHVTFVEMLFAIMTLGGSP